MKKIPPRITSLDTEELAFLPRWYTKTYFPRFRKPIIMGRRGVFGDGSCFFHALCAAQNTKNYLHVPPSVQKSIGHTFRCAFNKHINKQRWAKFLADRHLDPDVNFPQIQRQFCTSNHWADEIMITLVTDVLRLNIIFIDTLNGKIYCGVKGGRKHPLIMILWNNHKHFEPVFVVREIDGVSQPQFKFFWDKDKDVINSIMNVYKKQCGNA